MAGNGTGANGKSQLDLDQEIVFTTLTGDRLKTAVKRMSWVETEGSISCMLSLEAEWSVYQQMLSGEWMGLFARARNQTAEAGFEPERPVELRMILRNSLLPSAMRYGAEIEQVLITLLEDAQEARALGLSESWLVTEVKQQVHLPEELGAGSLRSGYRTFWSLPADVNLPPAAAATSTLHEVVEGYLNKMEIQYEWIQDHIARITYRGEQGAWIVLIRTDEAKQVCVVYSVYPVLVPKERHQDLAVFLMEENYDLAVGSFELDTSDGELRFRTSVDVENDRLTIELLGQLFISNIVVMDHYYHAIGDEINGMLE
ncbi:YbjN domain-containing protein [Paenibacillus sp. y28]|uniref:YbjN domain-containing protein n=1 Tax=Paenibacillus sp. y28 TaxID=3129110 RepID=UPI00301731E7